MSIISPAEGDVISVVINNGASHTNSVNVHLFLSAEDSSDEELEMKISNSSDFSSVNWETYVTSKYWALNSGDGTKTVYVKFRNITSLQESGVYTDTIILDTTAPQTQSPVVVINENQRYTTSRDVVLHFNVASEIGLEMQIVNDDSDDAIDDDWEEYSETKDWTLSIIDGIKTVYVRFRDAVENTTKWYSAEIILNTDALQVPTIVSPEDESTTTKRSVDVEGMAERGSKIIIKVT